MTTIRDAIDLYLAEFDAQFSSQHSLKYKRIQLGYFVEHLQAMGHSMLLADLTAEDGQRFLDTCRNRYSGRPLSYARLKQYRSAIRTFSRFLADAGILAEDPFARLVVRKPM